MYHWYRAAGLGRFADILTVSNFSGNGPGSRSAATRPGPVRHLRHGGQREGMVLDRDGRPPLPARRRMERAAVHVRATTTRGSRSTRAPATASGWRDTTEPLPAARRRARAESTRSAADVRHANAGRRRHLRSVSTAVRLRSRAAQRRRRGDRRDRAPWREHTRRVRRRLRRRADARVSLPAEERRRRRTRPSSSSRRRTHSCCDRAATCRSPGSSFIIRSGRAFLYPVYQGTYERTASGARAAPNAERELAIAWSRDLGRAIDYLETRAGHRSPRGWRSTA